MFSNELICKLLRWVHRVVFGCVSVPLYDERRFLIFLGISDDPLYNVFATVSLDIIDVTSAYDVFAPLSHLRFDLLRRWLFFVSVLIGRVFQPVWFVHVNVFVCLRHCVWGYCRYDTVRSLRLLSQALDIRSLWFLSHP